MIMLRNTKMKWWRITTNYACFAFSEKNGIVVETAPIASWAIGVDTNKVLAWYKKKGATIELLSDE